MARFIFNTQKEERTFRDLSEFYDWVAQRIECETTEENKLLNSML